MNTTHLLDTSAGANTVPWDVLGLAGLAFLIVTAGLARMGYISARRLIILSAFGLTYLIGTFFAQSNHHNVLAQREMTSVNNQLAATWPSVAKLNGGLLHSTPRAGDTVTILTTRGLECQLHLTDGTAESTLTADLTCGGQPVAPLIES